MDEITTIPGESNEQLAGMLYEILRADALGLYNLMSGGDDLECILEFTRIGNPGEDMPQDLTTLNKNTELPTDSKESFITAFLRYVEKGKQYEFLSFNANHENRLIPEDYGVTQSDLKIHIIKNGVKLENYYLISGVKQAKSTGSRVTKALLDNRIGMTVQAAIGAYSTRAETFLRRRLRDAEKHLKKVAANPLYVQVEHVQPTAVPVYQ